ncbi:reverse transcriptase domain-containing protein [Tanacetum coccineum]|uniref:Reverse transcriptase domain-containing protein n=1 Tax=Tanacetum coccineum TaxID=301880 RepID=A0ABQ5BFX8_9ASTR
MRPSNSYARRPSFQTTVLLKEEIFTTTKGLQMTYPPLRFEGLPFELKKDLLPNIPRNLRIVSSGVKPSSRWLPVWESATRRPTPFVGYSRLGNPAFTARTLRSPSKPDCVHICTISGAIQYFSEEYDEERDMEPRHVRVKETTPVLHTRSLRTRRQRERVVEFEDTPNRDGSKVERNPEAHLGRSENGQPLQSSLTSAYGGHQPSINMGWNLLPNGLFADPTGCVTLFVRYIEDYPLPDGLKMPSHMGSYDGKGDPDNYLHLFEDSARIWWNSQKAGNIVNYEDLKAKFWSHSSQQKKFTKTHLVVHNIKQREGESTRAIATRYTDDTLQILGLHEEQRISGFVHGLRTRSLVEFLSTDLPTTYRGLMEKTYTWIEAREVATYGTLNDHRESFDRVQGRFWKQRRSQKPSNNLLTYPKVDGQETCLRQLAHLVKGIKKEKVKASDTQLGEWKKGDKDTTPVEAPILMISRGSQTPKRKSGEEFVNEARISGRQVNRVYMDNGSSCEVIYEHCFLRLKPSIRSLRVDSKTQLVGFFGEHSWPLGEVPLEITIGATYQKLVDEVFNDQIGRNLEVQVDDMWLKKTFLGHLIMKQGIKENHLKVKAISDLQSSKMNYTNGKIVQWTTEAEEAFRKIKEFIKTLPTVTVLIKGETLVMYLAASEESISAVLLAEGGKKQVLVYFMSQTLQGTELEYLELEKIVLALVYAARRLRSRNEDPKYSHLYRLPVGRKLSQRTLRSKEANDKAIPKENKRDTQKLQEYSMEHRARKLRIKAPQYRMIDDKIYRKSYMSSWLRCVRACTSKWHHLRDTPRLMRDARRTTISGIKDHEAGILLAFNA